MVNNGGRLRVDVDDNNINNGDDDHHRHCLLLICIDIIRIDVDDEGDWYELILFEST